MQILGCEGEVVKARREETCARVVGYFESGFV